MYDLIRTNYAWVSVDGFLKFCKDLSRIDNWDGFTKEDLIKLYGTVTAHHKVRSNLNFAIALSLVTRINNHYKINDNNMVRNFFKSIKENSGFSMMYLSPIVKTLPFFQKIETDFFYDKKSKSTRDLKEFLRNLDKNNSKINYYKQGSRFFSKFLDKLRILNYNQRSQIISLRGYSPKDEDIVIQKRLIDKEKEGVEQNVFNEILNDISLYIKTIGNSEDLAKLMEVLPTEKRIQINSKLLEIARKNQF